MYLRTINLKMISIRSATKEMFTFFFLDGFGGRLGNKLIGAEELNNEIEKSLEEFNFFSHDKST